MKTLLIFLILTVSCFGQFDLAIPVNITKQQAIFGLESPVVAGDMVITKSAKDVKIKEIAVLDITSEAAILNVKASNKDRTAIQVAKLSRNTFAVDNTTDVWVRITAIDFDKKIYIDEERLVKASTPPEPDVPNPKPDEPTPNPTVPTDQFDNIGQRVAALTKGLSQNKDIAKIYQTLATELRTNPTLTVTEANTKLKTAISDLPENFDTNYSKVRDLINSDITKRWPMSKGVLADYWEAISKGFNLSSIKLISTPTEDCMCNAGGTPCTCADCDCGVKQ